MARQTLLTRYVSGASRKCNFLADPLPIGAEKAIEETSLSGIGLGISVWFKQLAAHYPEESLPDLKSTQVLEFLLHLQTERDLAGGTINQALCALRTFFRDHLDLRRKIGSKVKVRREEFLPHVFNREEVVLLLGTFHDDR